MANVRKFKLAVALRLAIALALIVCFLEAPLLELNLQGNQADCYGWRAMFRDTPHAEQRGLLACIDFLAAINTNGIASVSIKPGVASVAELSSICFLVTVVLIVLADLATVSIIAAARHVTLQNKPLKRETWILFLASTASFIRFLGVVSAYIGIHANATLRKEMANGDAFVAVGSQMGPGAYLIAAFTLVSFAIPQQYGA